MIPTRTDLETPVDSGELEHGSETLITEVGWRAAVAEVDQNDGGHTAGFVLAEAFS